jgi:hypothetical protein
LAFVSALRIPAGTARDGVIFVHHKKAEQKTGNTSAWWTGSYLKSLKW